MKKNIETISIIGAGNVAHHLATALSKANIKVDQIWSRDIANAKQLSELVDAEATCNLSDLRKSDLTIVAIPDDYVAAVINQLPKSSRIAYTSGSIQLNQLSNHPDIGVFYPLQSFSKSVKVDVSNVPFLIESSNDEFTDELKELADKLSKHVLIADSEYRAKVHLTAVWVNNFTNHILHQAWVYASKNNVDFELLKPLLKETIRKLDDDTPFNLQTGPARRGDHEIITKQLNELEEHQREIYLLLTESIIDTYTNDKL